MRYIVKTVPNPSGAPFFQVYDNYEKYFVGHPEFWLDKAEHTCNQMNAQDRNERELERVADEFRYQ